MAAQATLSPEDTKRLDAALVGMAALPWDTVEHAYGSAADVPGILFHLAMGTAEQAESAWSDLHCNLWHQGTVYSATPLAVPFLVALLELRGRNDRTRIAQYLRLLAEGTSYLEVHQHLMGPLDPDQQHQLSQERQWVEQLGETLLRLAPRMVAILADPTEPPVLRAEIAYALTGHVGTRPLVGPYLPALLRDSDPLTRSVAALAIAEFPSWPEGMSDVVAHQFASETDPGVRLALAAAAVKCPDLTICNASVEFALDVLSRLVVERQNGSDRLSQLTEGRFDPEPIAVEICRQAREPLRTVIIDDLCRRVPVSLEPLCSMLAQPLLAMTFTRTDGRPTPPLTLEPVQRQVLAALLAINPGCSTQHHLGLAFAYGLPGRRDQLEALLHGQPMPAPMTTPRETGVLALQASAVLSLTPQAPPVPAVPPAAIVAPPQCAGEAPPWWRRWFSPRRP